jgi:GTP-binding protein Era
VTRDRDESEGGGSFRAGFVALLGPPNAGKSTLLNRLLGEKLAIVSPKPQTTRSRILGVLSREEAQFLFLDSPGRPNGGGALNRKLNDTVDSVVRDCDMGLILLEPTRGFQPLHREFCEQLQAAKKPFLLAASKADLFPDAVELPADAAPADGAHVALRFSSLTGEGVPELLSALVPYLPLSPPLYPLDELTDRPTRWICAEMIREAIFECLQQELPYSMAVEIIEFNESRPEHIQIRANLLVERNSQKRIVVGRGGQGVKRIGIRARKALERFLGAHVDLRLFVKEDPQWMNSVRRLHELGYD